MDLTATTELLKRHEGLALKSYLCPVGILTVGYGRNLQDKGISEAEAELLLANDIDQVVREVTHYFDWFNRLNNARKSVIINMVFNLGLTGFKKFIRLIKALEIGYYVGASNEMRDSLWARQVGARAIELADAMENGFF